MHNGTVFFVLYLLAKTVIYFNPALILQLLLHMPGDHLSGTQVLHVYLRKVRCKHAFHFRACLKVVLEVNSHFLGF